MFAPAYNSL